MFYVATALLFDSNGKLLIYLRDDKPEIAFANHWDLFGGIIEEGEKPEEALVREVQEELGVTLTDYRKFSEYDSDDRIGKPNRKYVYYARLPMPVEELKLLEVGQALKGIDLNERGNYKFANILAQIIEDFALSGIKV
ncbi:MAG: NUDIX domain-containing protein [Chitinophagales bacterium]